MAVFKTKSAQDTKRIVDRLLPEILRARVIFLTGELGSGKTFFVKQLAEVLGIKEPVTSPSFQLIKEYQIPRASSGSITKLVHVDLYRVNRLPELRDYLEDESNLILIEWGEKLEKIIKPGLKLRFENKKGQWQIKI
jgi:tRNA threonylcarbamoyladenosine biosynthesis protein TsaE